MPKTTITIKGDKELEAAFKSFRADAIPEIQKAVLRAGNAIRNEVIKSVKRGSPTGRVYTWRSAAPGETPDAFMRIGGNVFPVVNRNIPHRASSPGQPPADDMGFLMQNVKIDIDSDGMGGSVTSKAPYSSFLEFGTRLMAARPFMVPALESKRKAIVQLFNRAIFAANKRMADKAKK